MGSHIEVQVCRAGEVVHTASVNGRPVVIGRAPSNDLVLEEVSWHHAVLWNEDGTLWVKNLDGDNGVTLRGKPVTDAAVVSSHDRLKLGVDFEIKIRESADTPPQAQPFFHYRLTVDMQSITGPEALIEDLETGRRCRIRSNNRVSVLYLLARQLEKDEALPDDERGWCNDQEVACGVWGRNWQKQIKSHLHVLVHRIRKDIKNAGLDPWCIEKKHCHTRAMLVEAVIR